MQGIGAWQVAGLVAGSSVLASALNQGAALISGLASKGRQRNFGRLYLALSLEEYAASCGDTISESELHDHSASSAGSPQTTIPPLPPYPETVDWAAIGLAATNRLLSLRVEVESIRAQMADCLLHDVGGAMEDTRTYAADMGVKALAIAGDLRRLAGAPIPAVDLEWSVAEYLESKQLEYRARRSRSAAAAAATSGHRRPDPVDGPDGG